MSSNPSTWNTSWKIGAKSGIYTDAEKAYTIYIKYAKQVYSGNDWQETDASEVLPYQFKVSAVGRTSIFFGTVNFSPRAFPVIIRIQKTPYL